MPDTPTPLLTEPTAIFVYLLGLVGVLFFASELRPFRKFFEVVPPLVFCYFLPMISTTIGIIPEASDLYSWLNAFLLPPLLLLLLLSADVRAIIRLGPKALTIMAAGSIGMMLGAVIASILFKDKLTDGGWHNLAALTGSWTGGSANMFAIKAAIDIPDDVFSPILIVDPLMCYSWMGLLIALAAWQSRYAKRFHIDSTTIEEMDRRVREYAEQKARPISTRDLMVILAIAISGGYVCYAIGGWTASQLKPLHADYPMLKTFSGMTITVIIVSIIGLTLSFTPLRDLEAAGASKIGYGMLYALIPTFGAQANLARIGEIPWYVACASVMILTHAIFIITAMWLLKTPLFFGATASQANVGGPASASVIASTYQPALAPVGVLLGILGGIFGTYCGLGVYWIINAIS